MSPLARIRQAAACSAFVSFAALALVATGAAPRAAGVALVAMGVATGADASAASTQAGAVAPPALKTAPPATPTNASQPPGAPAQPSSQPAAPAAESMAPAARPAAQAAATSATVQPPTPVQLAPNVAATIARSALLTVDGTATADALQLSIRRVSDKSPISSDDVTVAVDGKNQSVTREKSGVYELPSNDLRGDGARDVDVTVAHDGIREILSGKVAMVEASSTESLLRDHKQVAWWILNIVIVLIAAMAFSRRKG